MELNLRQINDLQTNFIDQLLENLKEEKFILLLKTILVRGGRRGG